VLDLRAGRKSNQEDWSERANKSLQKRMQQVVRNGFGEMKIAMMLGNKKKRTAAGYSK